MRHRADQISGGACPLCGGELGPERQFNLLFKTFLGATEDAQSQAYLRGELAQAMFVDFSAVVTATRRRLPFGIASQGRVFRNEITPGNFIFRTREFDLMEFEYFVREADWERQFEYWLNEMKDWLMHCGVDATHYHIHEIEDGERAHYSKRTADIEYDYPFGRKELYGLAYRTDFDLKNHMESSGRDMRYTDPETGEKFLPHVIEPTFGLDRTVLVAMLEAYHEEDAPTAEEGEREPRVVMKFPYWMAPYKAAVLPLSKKDELSKIAEPLAAELRKVFPCDYDETQSIGRRYRRQDEIGTPFCVTVDFETAVDGAVTVRNRDTMVQERIKIGAVRDYIAQKLAFKGQ
jgi:glycyl-tRNA synthetase